MRVFGFIPAHSSKKRPRLIAPKLLASAVTAALFATVVALGGSAAATTTGSPRASISISSPTAMGAAAAKYYLQQSGKGNKVLRSVALPSKWYLTWRFDCGTKKGDFVLTSTRKGHPSLTVARQGPDLGGGGQQP
jgi:predicted secreted Zn-dependent protease